MHDIRAVFTDLDATLLEHDGTLAGVAREALSDLVERGIPVVPVTSKTRAEVSRWLSELRLRFGVFENGAGFLGPGGATVLPGAVPVPRLKEALARLSAAAGLALTPLDELDDEEVCRLTGLSPAEVPAAKAREYDVPFLAAADGDRLERAAAGLRGLRLTRGGRFWHLLGDHDKSHGVAAVLATPDLARPGLVVGLGDAPNDADFLARVDVAILIPAWGTDELARRVPGARRALLPAGAGWAAAVRALLLEVMGQPLRGFPRPLPDGR